MPHPAPARERRPGRSLLACGADSAERLAPATRVRRAITLLVVTVLAPGTAQILAGSRVAGRVVRRVWAGLLAVMALFTLSWLIARPVALWLVTSPAVLTTVAVASFCWAVVMVVVMIDAWRLGRPDLLPIRARRWLAGGTVLLVLATGYPLLALGERAWAAAELIGGVFSGTHHSAAVQGRYNVLLLGGDAGPARIGTRPDSITVASVDAETGRTVLFSLPRNLENVPFPDGSPAAKAWPHGYSCGDKCLLNGLYTWAGEHPGLFPGVSDPGAEVMKEAAEGITGLKVNYYVLIDLAGFEQLIDALGGITVTVKAPVPIGGGTSKVSGYVQPGTRRLDGYHALWYARSRHGGSDYDRMARQRCVMDAMLHQLDPQAVLTNFQQIAAAGARVVSTDIPAGQLSDFIGLAARAKGEPVRSVQFVPPLIVPARPDFAVIRARVAQAVAASGGKGTAKTDAPASAGSPTSTAPAHTTSPSGRVGDGPAPPGAATTGRPTSITPVDGDDVSAVCSPG